MSYQAIALKYRPQNFDEMIGQESVTAQLKASLSSGRIHHAWLFSGPRGVGKTSAARILAKALNCVSGPSPSPCGTCGSCLDITRGASLDVIEIDGASNRGIDDIRSLRESARLSAAGSRFKVYIIDEVHQITNDGFNALLKTLEEPPQHVKFIFATTHPHKVPATILSRCQKFQFNLLSTEAITAKLKKVLAAEKIDLSDSLIYTIARAAEGSVRDAESLLDQIIPAAMDKAPLGDVLSFLGIISEEYLNQALEALVSADITAGLDLIERLASGGKDLGVFLASLIEHSRNLLLVKLATKDFRGLAHVSPQTKETVARLAAKSSVRGILKLIDALILAKEQSRLINNPRIPLELAFVRIGLPMLNDQTIDHRPKTIDPVSASRNGAGQRPTTDDKKPITKEQELSDQIDRLPETIDHRPETRDQQLPAGTETGPGPQQQDDLLLSEVRQRWPAVLSSLQKVRAALAAHLAVASPLSSKGKAVTIAFVKSDYFHKETVEAPKNQKFIETHLSGVMGKEIVLRFTLVETLPGRKTEPVTEEKTSAKAAPGNEEFMNELLDTFGGSIQTDE